MSSHMDKDDKYKGGMGGKKSTGASMGKKTGGKAGASGKGGSMGRKGGK